MLLEAIKIIVHYKKDGFHWVHARFPWHSGNRTRTYSMTTRTITWPYILTHSSEKFDTRILCKQNSQRERTIVYWPTSFPAWFVSPNRATQKQTHTHTHTHTHNTHTHTHKEDKIVVGISLRSYAGSHQVPVCGHFTISFILITIFSHPVNGQL